MNKLTAENRARAMNAVHKTVLDMYPKIVDVFTSTDPDKLYLKDGSLSKRVRDKIAVIKEQIPLTMRASIDTRHTVTMQIDCMYDRIDSNGNYNSTGYYKRTVYLVNKDSNEPLPLDSSEYRTDWTGDKLQAMLSRVNYLNKQMQELRRQRSILNYWTQD